MNSAARIGSSSPLGATIIEGGANFSLFSRGATGVELLFFDNESDARPSRVIPIDPAANRTYHYWHVFVPGVEPGQIYGYRVQGASDPSKGMRFDPTKYSSIHTVAVWLCLGTTAAIRPARWATTPRPP